MITVETSIIEHRYHHWVNEYFSMPEI